MRGVDQARDLAWIRYSARSMPPPDLSAVPNFETVVPVGAAADWMPPLLPRDQLCRDHLDNPKYARNEVAALTHGAWVDPRINNTPDVAAKVDHRQGGEHPLRVIRAARLGASLAEGELGKVYRGKSSGGAKYRRTPDFRRICCKSTPFRRNYEDGRVETELDGKR